jgi:hypothetical protein
MFKETFNQANSTIIMDNKITMKIKISELLQLQCIKSNFNIIIN